VPPVPAVSTRAARVPHRRTSVAAARAASPLPYPAPVRHLAVAPDPAPDPPDVAPTPAEAAPPPARTPAPDPAPAPAATPGPPAGRARPEPLPPLPANAVVPAIRTSVADLLALARHGVAEAATATSPPERYAAAHLGALRAAAAVIAARATPTPAPARRTKPLSAWMLLSALAPDLGEWAAFFAAGAPKRANAEARIPGCVTAREADDLLRDAETFLAVVETKLGGAARPSLLAALDRASS
jgi:hypothetical protein